MDNLIPELLNIAYSCSKHGPVNARLTSERPAKLYLFQKHLLCSEQNCPASYEIIFLETEWKRLLFRELCPPPPRPPRHFTTTLKWFYVTIAVLSSLLRYAAAFNYMEESPLWEANSWSPIQDIPHTSSNRMGAWPCSSCSLRWTTWIQSTLTPQSKIHFNIITPCRSKYFRKVHPSGFCEENLVHLSQPSLAWDTHKHTIIFHLNMSRTCDKQKEM